MGTRVERGMAGHFICASRCRWHRCTDVNEKWRVSSVGCFQRNDTDRQWSEIGCDRLFETMVFRLGSSLCKCGCGEREIDSFTEIDFAPYNTVKDAQAGHEEMVAKWMEIEEYPQQGAPNGE